MMTAVMFLLRALSLSSLLAVASPMAAEPGWQYSPLPGEGDRASLGCDREATETAFTCLVVRCEDDFSTGIYVHSSLADDTGRWEMTVDRENRSFAAEATTTPYGGRIVEGADWLLERLKQGTFVYLRHEGDEGPFRFIDLSGSLYAINAGLAWCAPRVPRGEPIREPSV